MKKKLCAYCGSRDAPDKEHVFPACLYPKSKQGSTIQRMTVPACKDCNYSWQDDEVHFRSVLLVSGDPNSPVLENWETVRRSWEQPDGRRRVSDLAAQLVAVETSEGLRHMIYPAKDPRVMRVIRKIARGLCFHHQLDAPVPDSRVWADVQRFQVPPALLDEMKTEHREADIVQYRYAMLSDGDLQSLWLLKFFERTHFIAIVSRAGVKD